MDDFVPRQAQPARKPFALLSEKAYAIANPPSRGQEPLFPILHNFGTKCGKLFSFAAEKEAARRDVHKNGDQSSKAAAAGENRRNGKGLFHHALPGPVRKKNPERALSGGGKEGSHAFGTENDRKQGIFSLDRGEKR